MHPLTGRVFQQIYSQPSLSAGSTFKDLTNCKWKTAFSIPGWESADAEGRLCIVLFRFMQGT